MQLLQRGLGKTHPLPINVRVNPFPASLFNIFCWIVVTNTKLCPDAGFKHPRGYASLQMLRPPTHLRSKAAQTVCYLVPASAPSIFRANPFGSWLVTNFLATSCFHGHSHAFYMIQHFFGVYNRTTRRLNHTYGSSHVARSLAIVNFSKFYPSPRGLRACWNILLDLRTLLLGSLMILEQPSAP